MRRYFVLLGAPGAGKGTQAGFLSEKLGLVHVASGDLFREALAKGTELGLRARSFMERGVLVPDGVTIAMILERIAAPDCREGTVFDGFPRTIAQAHALDKALAADGEGVEKALYIDVSEAELLNRLTSRYVCGSCQTPYNVIAAPPKKAGVCDRCGGELIQRPDDREETIRERLKVYFAETMPLLEYYRRAGRLIEVEGELGIEDVARRMLKAIGKGR
ncbi:MAG: adenylate kinase [Chloroflexota bacterium]